MIIRELAPENVNEASRRFLLGWRRGCFTLVAALYVLILFQILPFRPLFTVAGLSAALICGLWLIFQAQTQRMETDVGCMAVSVVLLALKMYFATGDHASQFLSEAIFAVSAFFTGLCAGRMTVRLVEAELYSFQLYNRNACLLQTVIEVVVLGLFAIFGLRIGKFFVAEPNELLYACLLLLFAVVSYAVYLKFRTVVPLEHSRRPSD